MTVSVIIPFRNKTLLVEECIESVKKQSYKNIEIIAVSDRDKVSKAGVKSLVNPNCKGVGDKRNLGAKKAKGDVLFFLDSDCIVKKDTVESLIKIFKRTNADAVSGKPLAPRKSNLLGYVTGLEYEDRFDQMGENFVNVAATTCLGVKKSVFFKVGGFKDYTTGEATGEDWDFSTRLTRVGFKIFHTNKVQVYHEHKADTFLHFLKRHYQHARYRITHYKRYKSLTDSYSTWNMFLSSTILFGIPPMIRLFLKKRDIKILLLPLICFSRSISWCLGFLAGILFDR